MNLLCVVFPRALPSSLTYLQLKRQREFTETAREDVQQWKDQVTRQQEAHSQDQAESLQEVQDWKDRFRRAEKERLRTAAKLEEVFCSSQILTSMRATDVRV
jgi:flagellar motility protein MotE (MotC chaperone)